MAERNPLVPAIESGAVPRDMPDQQAGATPVVGDLPLGRRPGSPAAAEAGARVGAGSRRRRPAVRGAS